MNLMLRRYFLSDAIKFRWLIWKKNRKESRGLNSRFIDNQIFYAYSHILC